MSLPQSAGDSTPAKKYCAEIQYKFVPFLQVLFVKVKFPSSKWRVELQGNEMLAGTKIQKASGIFPVVLVVQI